MSNESSGRTSRPAPKRTNTICAPINLARTQSNGSAARDLYLRCVEADPCWPAWAGFTTSWRSTCQPAREKGLDQAQAAFRQALDLNPDLTIGHKCYAQLELLIGCGLRPRNQPRGRARTRAPRRREPA